MGYYISAFIARQGFFAHYREKRDRVTVAPLNQGFELILNSPDLEEVLGIVDGYKSEDVFENSELRHIILDHVTGWSRETPIAYVEADFRGGVGYQFGAFWKDGELILTPKTNGEWGLFRSSIPSSEWPINAVLKLLGVTVHADKGDEFQAVGLQKHRSNEDWFEEYTGYSMSDYYPWEIN